MFRDVIEGRQYWEKDEQEDDATRCWLI